MERYSLTKQETEDELNGKDQETPKKMLIPDCPDNDFRTPGYL